MTTLTAPYFHAGSLKARFLDDIETAVEAERINIDESLWLACVARPEQEGDAAPPRVDRLSIDAGVPTSFEFAAARIFSYADRDDSRIYLHTLLQGIERFDDRARLLAALNTRFASGNTSVTFEYEKIEGDCFEGQMLAIVDHQVACLAATTESLHQLPSVRTAMAASMQAQVLKALPGTALDVHSHVLQIVQRAGGLAAEEVLTTQTLSGAALEAYVFPVLPKGVELRFLDSTGKPVSPAQALSLQGALTASGTHLEAHLLAQLKTYWQTANGRHASRRQQLVHGFSECFRQEVYRRLHDGTIKARMFDDLKILLQSPQLAVAADAPLRVRRMSMGVGVNDEFPVKLAGTFLIEFVGEQRGEVLWFSPEHDLLRFNSRQLLLDYLARPDRRNQLKPCLSLNDRNKLSSQGELHLRLDNVEAPLFEDRVDSVIAWQERNVKYALSFSLQSDSLLVMIDDALDVRERLDPRQMQFTQRRWGETIAVDFDAIWRREPVETSTDLTVPERLELPSAVSMDERLPEYVEPKVPGQSVLSPATELVLQERPSWLEKLQGVDVQAKLIDLAHEGVQGYAARALNRYLRVLSTSAVDAGNVRVQWLLSSPTAQADPAVDQIAVGEFANAGSIALIDLLLERVSGCRALRLPDDTRTLQTSAESPDAWPMGHINRDLIEHMLDRVASDFSEQYQLYVRQFHTVALRQGDQQWWPGAIEHGIRDDMLRLGLAVERRMASIDADALELVQQVLDRPLRSLRTSLGDAFTEAYSLTFKFGAEGSAAVSNAFVLIQPLKADSKVMLWSSLWGWRGFSSLALLHQAFASWISRKPRRSWLRLLCEEDRLQLAEHLNKPTGTEVTVQLDKIEGNIIDVLQQGALNHLQDGIRQTCDIARRSKVQADLFKNLAQAAELDQQLEVARDGLRLNIDNALLNAMLPTWMRCATLGQMDAYASILRDYSLVSAAGEDYLFDVMNLRDFAKDKLQRQLLQDFPDKVFKTDDITVKVLRYVAAPPGLGQTPSGVPAAAMSQSESLTEYALNRFSGVQDATLSVTAKDDPEAQRLLTQTYLRQMTQQMDVGAQYRQLVNEKLDEQGAQYALRNRYFLDEIPSMMLSVAFEDKLEGQLSDMAYSFVHSVVRMPDGLAREPVDGQAIIMTPLQLVLNASRRPDIVSGVYLIGPRDPDAGPLVLHAIYHEGFTYKEYANQAALLMDIRSNEDLQKLLLSRLHPAVVQSYGSGGFIKWLLSSFAAEVDGASINTPGYVPVGTQGHVALDTPGLIGLAYDEIKGNALQLLFVDTIKVIRNIVQQQTTTNAEVNSSAIKFLLGEAVEQTLMFLPGKLGSLVAIWQSQSLLRASADAVSNRRWGKALSEFVAALGVLASTREASEEEDPVKGKTADDDIDTQDPATTFSWAETELSAPQKLALQAMEVKSVALADLRKDPLNNFYEDIRTGKFYAAVVGKVYEVRRISSQGQWMITAADGSPGPRLKLDQHQRWQLDLSMGLKGGGGMVTKYRSRLSNRSVEQVMTITARGMPEIRMSFPDKAIAIRRAWSQAKLYLENCLDNLQPQPDTGVLDPEVPRIIGAFFGVKKVDRQLLKVTEEAIRPVFTALMDSSLSPYDSTRFTIGTRIAGNERTMAFVIKGEAVKQIYLTDLFFEPPPFYLNQRSVDEGFDVIGHYGGTALIHEVTHLVSHTHDITYLHVEAPFPDLLRDATPDSAKRRTEVLQSRIECMSHLTPKHDLFEPVADLDRDAYDAILDITDSDTLEEAREVFLTDALKRQQILLTNADSVTLLIQNLGRYNYRKGH